MTTTSKTRKAPATEPVMELGADLSPAVAALEKAYRMIQRKYPDAPPVTIVVKRDAKAWGHTTVAKVWAPAHAATNLEAPADRFEIMISGENLRRGAVDVAATLLHEAAHARNLAKGELDTDVNGRHNRKFADTAEEHGLKVSQVGWHGWTGTELDAEGQKRWKAMLAVIETGLRKSAATAPASIDHLPGGAASLLPPVPGKPTLVGPGAPAGPAKPRRRGDRNLTKATCECGYSIRASEGVLRDAAPTCSECKTEFLPEVKA